MNRYIFVSAVISIGMASAWAQNAVEANSTGDTSSGPIAFVYVAQPTQITGFAASASGTLTAVPGSPFTGTKVFKLSVTKNFLFGESTDPYFTITGFAIAGNGSLSKVSSVPTWKYEPHPCGVFPDIQVDFTNSTLYHQACASNASYLSFHIESNGDLQYLGASGGNIDFTSQGETFILTMGGTNQFAYDGYCAEDSDTPVIDIYKRESNGNLLYIGQENQAPTPAPGTAYCFGMVAADTANHLAVAVQRIDSQPHDNGYIYGPYFLASYTADSNGNLSTTSTYENMPETTVAQDVSINAMSISPSNQYLAVGGPNGFQVFRFKGSAPISGGGSVHLPGKVIAKFGWDKANHLYVLQESSPEGNFLYVYNVNSSGVYQAPGSPYPVFYATNIIVRDL